MVIVAPIIYLILFNGVVQYLRVSGFLAGYREGIKIVSWLNSIRYRERINNIKKYALLLLGAFTGLYLCRDIPFEGTTGTVDLIMKLFGFAIVYFLYRMGLHRSYKFYILILFGIIFEKVVGI